MNILVHWANIVLLNLIKIFHQKKQINQELRNKIFKRVEEKKKIGQKNYSAKFF